MHEIGDVVWLALSHLADQSLHDYLEIDFLPLVWTHVEAQSNKWMFEANLVHHLLVGLDKILHFS